MAPVQVQPEVFELDELTLARVQRGDRRAAKALIERYQDRVYALVSRMLGRHPSSVDDTAQDVFLKVLRHIPRFDPRGPARLSTWILTIATRTCLDLLRGAERSERSDRVEALRWGHERRDPESAIATAQLSRKVTEAVSSLPPEHRAVLVLRAFHDFDYPEIAEALALEEGTVKSRLARARERLRELFPGTTHG